MDKKNNTGWYNAGDNNSGDFNTGDNNSGDKNSGWYNTGSYNSGDYNPGDKNSGDFNTGWHNSGGYNTGSYNTGWYNSGNWNSCNEESGYFNSIDDDTVRVFNKRVSREVWGNKQIPKWLYFNLELDIPKWIEYEDMSDEQKEQYEDAERIGGALIGGKPKELSPEERTLQYKQAAQKAWNNTTEEDRQLTFKLPNFDAQVFYDIFGIDVRGKENETQQNTIIILNGKKYNISGHIRSFTLVDGNEIIFKKENELE